ncbi:hypothetical protein ACIP39_28895 [Streptomyces tibetensis]|uniref:hypothetical protein n=1 Tax=Streptomyces tibetensis TaxID=2382123 RepID=UPI003812EFE2
MPAADGNHSIEHPVRHAALKIGTTTATQKAPQLKPPVSADSLRLEETGDKRLRWENDKGKQVASVPVPLMWDSSQDKDSGEPEHAAQVTIQVQDTAGDEQTLVLSPDQDFLSDPDAEYPVVIDPTNTLPGPITDTWVQYDDFPNSQRGSTQLKAGTYDGTEKAQLERQGHLRPRRRHHQGEETARPTSPPTTQTGSTSRSTST